jgi:iron(III) transport system permease protein
MMGAMLLGVPLAALTTRYVIRGRNLLSTLSVLALVSPPFIGAYAWIMMLGRNGFVRTSLESATGIELPSIYGFFGIILVFSLKFYPFVFLLAPARSRRSIPPSRKPRKVSAPARGGASSRSRCRWCFPRSAPARC